MVCFDCGCCDKLRDERRHCWYSHSPADSRHFPVIVDVVSIAVRIPNEVCLRWSKICRLKTVVEVRWGDFLIRVVAIRPIERVWSNDQDKAFSCDDEHIRRDEEQVPYMKHRSRFVIVEECTTVLVGRNEIREREKYFVDQSHVRANEPVKERREERTICLSCPNIEYSHDICLSLCFR